MAKSFSKNNIISVIKERNNLVGITEGGDEKHLGGTGGTITNIINSGNHAIIIHDNGSKIMFRFTDQSMRQI